MSIIGPPQRLRNLQRSAQAVRDGSAKKGLPAVVSDALQMDKAAYEQNRKLARLISEAMAALTPSDKDGPFFVLGWRMYPNADHPRWKEKEVEGSHTCGCGCGGTAPGSEC
jgi:hypothetical protein